MAQTVYGSEPNKRKGVEPKDPSRDTFEQRFTPDDPLQKLYEKQPIPGTPIEPGYQERNLDPTKVISQMMLPTVPQMNPVAPFNKPQFPGMPQTGMGTNLNQQLLTLLGGLGGMPANPLAPGIARPPQPGPPTNTATQILGALGSTNP